VVRRLPFTDQHHVVRYGEGTDTCSTEIHAPQTGAQSRNDIDMTTTQQNRDEADLLYIANTIRHQIGIKTLMAVGARELVALRDDDRQNGGLRFSVGSGSNHHIIVRLRWDDTYEVESVKIDPRTRGETVAASLSWVYCDDLSNIVCTLASTT
jgi:hypothetical protein